MTNTLVTLKWAGLLLGFSLGGFFDGILLHQVLQWHHLLSNVAAVGDMRMQIMADGLFHALMYAIAAVALMKLWRARAATAEPGASRRMGGHALVGFGGWHIVDGLLSHWLLGIHRIRVDSPDPLMWDLIWFFVFGALPVLTGWWMLRRPRPPARRGGRTSVTLALAALIAGPLAALPAGSDTTQIIVVFAPGIRSPQAFDALAKLDARVLWVDRSGGTWAVDIADPGQAWQLYGSGAMLVSNAGFSMGCISWTKTGST